MTKSLTFQGAQSGHDGRNHRDASKESIVSQASGADFTIQANNVTIDGFTISGVDASSTDLGIAAFSGTSGLVVQNNIISGNCEGMNFQNPDGSMPASIQRNLFSHNTAGSVSLGANCGTGAFISNGPANNTMISDNTFTGHNSGQTAVNFAGSSNLSVGLSLTHNLSIDDSTFVVANNSNGAVISENEVDVTTPDPNQGTAILDWGSNVNLSITNNKINGGANTGTSGINVRDLSGPPSVNTSVTNNQVTGRWNGLRVTDNATGATISNNHVMKSQNDGINVSASGNTFSHNNVEQSTVHDCQDTTSGLGTGGTANTWTDDQGHSNNSSPAAICHK